jgi:hypothetical protein
MVKTTYLPNTIRISTHGVNFSHIKSSDFGEDLEIINGAVARWVEEKEGRGKERRKKEEGEPYSMDESRHGGWRESFVSHIVQHGVTQSTFDETCLSVVSPQSAWLSHVMCTVTTQADVAPHRHRTTRLPYGSHQCTLHNFFISRANQILKICFSLVHFSIFFKKSQNTKNHSREMWMWIGIGDVLISCWLASAGRDWEVVYV